MKTIWIGRDEGSGRDWLEAARKAGWEGRALPLIRREPVAPDAAGEAALADLQRGDWLFLTSAAAVRLGLKPLHSRFPLLQQARLAVVGPGTAAALRRARGQGLPLPEASLMADGRGGAALAEAFLNGPGEKADRERPLYWMRAKNPRPELAEQLESAGWRLVGLPVYRVEGVDGPVPESHQPVLLFSPSGARALSQRVAVPGSCSVYALGATTAAAAVEAGFQVIATLDQPSAQAFADCLR